jgi:hypothetical protein
MPAASLPQIHLGDLAVSRLLAGGNPISGFSHQTSERSTAMLAHFTVERIKQHLRACEDNGVTGLVARADAFIMRVLSEHWRDGGHIRWVAQTAPEYRDPMQNVRAARQAGASAVFVHGGEVDRLFAEGRAADVAAIVDAVHDLGLPAGMAAHDPCNHLEADGHGIHVDFHMVCLYNITGYRGRRQDEPGERFDPAHRALALDALRQLGRPCLAYKVLGAGRLSIDQALTDVGRALRPIDGIVIGMFPPDRDDIVAENVRAVSALT